MKIRNIWICIPTLRRVHLLGDCLDSIGELNPPDGAHISVILVDNDSDQSAMPIVSERQNFPFPLAYICEPQRGLSRARNAGVEKILAEGGGDVVLFVDDDMRLPPGYLKDVVVEMERLRADAVRGRMRIVKENGHIQIPRRASLFSRRDVLPGNGILVAMRVFDEWRMRFDPRFMRGFEDGDFTYRAHLRGARMFLLEHVYFFEFRPQSRTPQLGRKKELYRLSETRSRHVGLRRYRGGILRALLYMCRRGVPLILQAIGHALLFLSAPKKRRHKLENCVWRLAGLVRGLRELAFFDDEKSVKD